jgi:uncharacterized UBP type Zn finger protein
MHTVNGIKEKICRPIHVPEYITVSSKLSSSNRFLQYRIDSFIEHMGDSARGGHYRFYLATPDEEYFLISDDLIYKIDKETFLTKALNAYMYLFKFIG